MRKAILFLLFAYGFNVNAQIITTIAGSSILGTSGDGGQATAAGLLGVRGIAVDSKDNLFICTFPTGATYKAHLVRKVNTSGIISTIAGTDTSGFSGDGGPATAARLNYPEKIETDKYGNIYIADRANNRVRKIDTFGIITTFAGNGSTTLSGDGGPATAAGIGACYAVYCDTAGNVFLSAGNKIRKVNTSGIITTYAGTGVYGFSGDGGPATAAQIYGQGQIVMDRKGNLFFGDVGNERVRKINAEGIITTVAGTGVTGNTGDGGMATLAAINTPSGIFLDDCDNLYIVTQLDHKVRVVNGSGIIKTFAGIGTYGFNGDGGPATAAKLSFPTGIYINKIGNIYIADFSNLRVRYIHMDSCRNTTEVPVSEVASAGLTVMPNPSSGACTIRLSSLVDEPVAVVVTDVVGTVIKRLAATTNRHTELMLHTPGLYLITATTATGKWTQKILIE